MSRPSRVLVLGCSGSGKSTLGMRLARKLDLPFIPTDNVYWRSDWTPAPAPDVHAWVHSAAGEDRWVMDGNFDAQREILWSRAELAIWLDLPWGTTVGRVVRRNLRWWVLRTPIWGGLRMTLRRAWGGIRHAARSHALKRRTYPDLLAAFPNLQVVHIQSTRQLEGWMRRL